MGASCRRTFGDFFSGKITQPYPYLLLYNISYWVRLVSIEALARWFQKIRAIWAPGRVPSCPCRRRRAVPWLWIVYPFVAQCDAGAWWAMFWNPHRPVFTSTQPVSACLGQWNSECFSHDLEGLGPFSLSCVVQCFNSYHLVSPGTLIVQCRWGYSLYTTLYSLYNIYYSVWIL